MPNRWTAHYLDGRTATRHHITVAVTSHGLHLFFDNGETTNWPYHQTRQTHGGYAGEEVRFEHGIEAVVVATPAIVTAIHDSAPTMASHFHHPLRHKSHLYWTVCAAVGILFMVGGLYRWGIPSLAATATPYVPLAWEDRLGQQVIDHLAPEARQCHNVDRLRKLDHLLASLTSTAADSSYSIRLSIVDDLAVNAFAAPGGRIVILRGLLEKTDSPEQLAGVLAHELQHIYRRHSTRAILERTASTLLISAITGGLTGGVTWGLEGAKVMGSLHYSRIHESEADVAGLHMLQAAGIDPIAMIAFYEILEEDAEGYERPAEFLSTHPDMKERRMTLMSLVGTPPANTVELLPGEDWDDIRTLCRLERD